MIIGITGKARSGKDTVAAILVAQHGFTRIAFADPLKRAAQAIFGLTEAQTWDDDLKEIVIPYWGMSPRSMFQQLGVEAVKRTFGHDVWAKRWAMSFEAVGDNVVATDCRFDTEAALIRSLGGIIIEVIRGPGLNGSTGDHSSERGLSTLPDITIDNNGSIKDLSDVLYRKLFS